MCRRRLFLPAALLAAVLAAAIALGLWYTRPRSWDALVGNAEAAVLPTLRELPGDLNAPRPQSVR